MATETPKSQGKSTSKPKSFSSSNGTPTSNWKGSKPKVSESKPSETQSQKSKVSPVYLAMQYPQLIGASTKFVLKVLEELKLPPEVIISGIKVFLGHGNDKDISAVNEFLGLDDYSVVNYYDVPQGVLADLALKSEKPDLAYSLLNSLAEKLKPVLEKNSTPASPQRQ